MRTRKARSEVSADVLFLAIIVAIVGLFVLAASAAGRLHASVRPIAAYAPANFMVQVDIDYDDAHRAVRIEWENQDDLSGASEIPIELDKTRYRIPLTCLPVGTYRLRAQILGVSGNVLHQVEANRFQSLESIPRPCR